MNKLTILLFLFLVSSLFGQDAQQYVTTKEGTKIYYDEIKPNAIQKKFKASNGEETITYEAQDIQTMLCLALVNKYDTVSKMQWIFFGAPSILIHVDEESRDYHKIELSRGRVSGRVFYANKEAVLVQTEKNMDGEVKTVFAIVKDDRIYYLLMKKEKAYSFIQETFDDEKLVELYKKLHEINAFDFKGYLNNQAKLRGYYMNEKYMEL